MKEILWHGRGGQGAFTAAKLLGAAYALQEGKQDGERYSIAFPSFGPERRGAPIRAFTKLDEKPIGDRSEIQKADISVFLDDTLFCETDLGELKPNGIILLNSKKQYEDVRVLTIDGDRLAWEILKLPITNTILLGALAVILPEITLLDIEKAILGYMPEKLQKKNIFAVRAAAEAMAKEGGKL